MQTIAGLTKLVPPCPRSVVRCFAKEFPNRGMLESVVAGRNPGWVWVDDPTAPRAVILASGYGWCYASDAVTAEQCAAVIEVDRRLQTMNFLVPPGSPWESLFPQADAVVERLEFSKHRKTWNTQPPLPAGVVVQPMTLPLLEQCLWRSEAIADCGSLERFLQIGFGNCAVYQGKPLCESYGSIVGDETIEIGIITHPDWRGRGLAHATCASVVDGIYARGYRPWWSCDRDNHGSRATARKLGFTGERPILLYEHRRTRNPAT